MCSYVVFFVLCFSSLGVDRRLLQDPALPGRRNLGMFGHEKRRHYEDYFAQGRSHHAARRDRRYQTPVGGDDIKLHDLPDHFPFDKEDGDHWEQILEKSKAEADALAAKSKAADDAEANSDAAAKKSEKNDVDKSQNGKDEGKADADVEKSKGAKKEADGDKSTSGASNSDTKQPKPGCSCEKKQDACPCNQNDPPAVTQPMQPAQPMPAPQTPQFLVNPQNNGLPEKHGQQASQNYVPDTVPQKKACEFSPAECFCGSRPTQQMDLLCASKKREYCGWFCKHKMGGREGKPKTGPDQYAGEKPKLLKPINRDNPRECGKPSLKTCEAIYSDPNSPDYVGDGYAPPGANCVCHIDQKTGHAVITDLPNTAALQGANAGSSAAPAGAATSGAPAAGAPSGEMANSNGAGPDSGNAATNAINSAAADAVQGIQSAQNSVNAAGQAATDTVNAATQAAENIQEESKGMWHHAKGFAKAAGGHVSNAASGVWNGVKNVGKAIFGDEAESQLQSGHANTEEYYLSGGRQPTRDEASVSARNGLSEVFESDDEVALGVH